MGRWPLSRGSWFPTGLTPSSLAFRSVGVAGVSVAPADVRPAHLTAAGSLVSSSMALSKWTGANMVQSWSPLSEAPTFSPSTRASTVSRGVGPAKCRARVAVSLVHPLAINAAATSGWFTRDEGQLAVARDSSWAGFTTLADVPGTWPPQARSKGRAYPATALNAAIPAWCDHRRRAERPNLPSALRLAE